MGFPGGSDGKESACSVGDPGSIPGSGRYPGEGNGNPLQYSCLENPMIRGAWQATIHGVVKRWSLLSDFSFFLPSFLPLFLPFPLSLFLSHPSLATGKTIALTRLTFVDKVMSPLFNMLSAAAAAAAKSLQSCPSLCDAIDGSSPGSPVPGILQAKTLEWVAISFSNA